MYHWLSYLPFLAASLHVLAFVLYAKQVFKNESVPKVVSWGLWAFLATLSAFSFRQMSDTVTALVSLTGSVGGIIIFLYVLIVGKFTRPTKGEWEQLIAGVIAILVWMNLGATAANMLLIGIAAWSFIPTYVGVWKNPRNEKPAPWLLWAVAYLFICIFIFLFRDGWSVKMVMPITLAILHGIVPILVSKWWVTATTELEFE